MVELKDIAAAATGAAALKLQDLLAVDPAVWTAADMTFVSSILKTTSTIEITEKIFDLSEKSNDELKAIIDERINGRRDSQDRPMDSSQRHH